MVFAVGTYGLMAAKKYVHKTRLKPASVTGDIPSLNPALATAIGNVVGTARD